MSKISGRPAMGLEGHKVLVLTSELKSNVVLSARNLQNVDVMRYSDASTYDILHAESIVIEPSGVWRPYSGSPIRDSQPRIGPVFTIGRSS